MKFEKVKQVSGNEDMNRRIKTLKHKSLLILVCLGMLVTLSSCSNKQSIDLEIRNHSLNSVDDAWAYIYNVGEDIPGYTKETEVINDFTLTVYRSIYEYDTMHPMVILFIEQPKDTEPCAYGIKIKTDDGEFNYGFSASPYHCLLLNTAKQVDVICDMYLYGEEGEDILDDIFTNHKEDKMEEYSTKSISYSLHITNGQSNE